MAGTSQLIQIDVCPPVRVPKPEWLRAKAPVGENFHNLKKLARGLGLHSVHPYYRVKPPQPGLLVGFAGLSCNQIRAAVELLGRCLDEIS